MTIYFYKNDLPDNFEIEGSLAIDTETMGLNNFRDRLCLLQFSNGNGDAHLVQFLDNDYKAPNLKKLLSDPQREIIFHFARFDVAVIYLYLGILVENIYCTKIASRLSRTYTGDHGLKDLCRELLQVQISKQQQSSDWGRDDLTKDQHEYAASDVLHLHALKEKLDIMLAREKRSDLAMGCFGFLPLRVLLDIEGFSEDIFAYKTL